MDKNCADCKKEFNYNEPRITGGSSMTIGDYYPDNSPAICKVCIDKRYEKRMREVEEIDDDDFFQPHLGE